jgi:hypothetical protein
LLNFIQGGNNEKLGLLLFLFFLSALIQAADIKQYCPWLTANADKWQFIYRAESKATRSLATRLWLFHGTVLLLRIWKGI